MTRSVVLPGGSGFIGTSLARRLTEAGQSDEEAPCRPITDYGRTKLAAVV